MSPSPGEVAARVAATLIEHAERRQAALEPLSELVARAVREIDPAGDRDHTPTWWRDVPGWVRLDPFDRFRRAHDQVVVIEAQAAEVVNDLRGMFALAPKGSAERPLGYTPAKAHAVLMTIAIRRAEALDELAKAIRTLEGRSARTRSIGRMDPETAAGLRQVIRQLIRTEEAERGAREKLTLLLSFLSSGEATALAG